MPVYSFWSRNQLLREVKIRRFIMLKSASIITGMFSSFHPQAGRQYHEDAGSYKEREDINGEDWGKIKKEQSSRNQKTGIDSAFKFLTFAVGRTERNQKIPAEVKSARNGAIGIKLMVVFSLFYKKDGICILYNIHWWKGVVCWLVSSHLDDDRFSF